jgi:hypothetical protein
VCTRRRAAEAVQAVVVRAAAAREAVQQAEGRRAAAVWAEEPMPAAARTGRE